MAIAQLEPKSPPQIIGPDVQRVARVAGVLYLLYFIMGIASDLYIKGKIYAAGDPELTLSHLVEHASLARLGIGLQLGIVLIQALLAVMFFRLFRGIDSFSAGALAAFGLVNAVAIMASTAVLVTAFDVAHEAPLTVAGGAAPTAQLLYVASDHLWGVGSLFFGLWLLPMGWLVIRSRWLPRQLGWILVVGGFGYTISAFVGSMFRNADLATFLLQLPSIVGEVWIMGYLLVAGVRLQATQTSSTPTPS